MGTDKFIVSTARQGRSGLGLEAQQDTVLGFPKGIGGRVDGPLQASQRQPVAQVRQFLFNSFDDDLKSGAALRVHALPPNR